MFAGRIATGDIWVVDTRRDLQGFKIDLNEPGHLVKTQTVSFPRCQDAIFSLTSYGILVYERQTGRLRFSSNSGDFDRELIGVDEIVSTDSKFITVCNRTVITLFDVSSFPLPIVSIANTEDVVQCLAISQTFHILCTATRDDRLHIFSLKNLHQTHSVMMPKSSARSIIITPSWGFIGIDLGGEIMIFSINAEFLTSYRHDCQFSYITAISSPDDFDYIIFSDIKGNLMMFEAYKSSNHVKLAQLLFPVCFIDYDRDGDWIVVVSPVGKMMVIVHPFVQLLSST
jgi:hypothetical protein